MIRDKTVLDTLPRLMRPAVLYGPPLVVLWAPAIDVAMRGWENDDTALVLIACFAAGYILKQGILWAEATRYVDVPKIERYFAVFNAAMLGVMLPWLVEPQGSAPYGNPMREIVLRAAAWFGVLTVGPLTIISHIDVLHRYFLRPARLPFQD